MSKLSKENRFLNALSELFTGAKVEGDSGYVNLMHIKREYFRGISEQLIQEVDKRVKPETSAREELFDKLYTFFGRYFCESGSIYFRHVPAFARIYEHVYNDERDIALVWKTRMLYYVKSDTLVRSMPITIEQDEALPCHFYFNAESIQHKKNNERKDFVFNFAAVERQEGQRVLCLVASYSENGKGTKTEDILSQARKHKFNISEEQLQKAIRVFRRQTEADYFINKDARRFLREQFDLWLYQYMFSEKTEFDEKRVQQLQAIQHTAYDIIEFIAQFEDELCRVWEKPKFARDVNYVITLDRLPKPLLAKISKHKNAQKQIREWRELGLIDKVFDIQKTNKPLPLDSKYFKDMEVEILSALGNLDEALDGELVHSENWQALNTLKKRYRGKIQCIYIDPPFNLGDSDQFDYRTNYKDSCWATMLENRLALAREFLADDGSIFVRCDYNGNWIVRPLMDSIFGADNFINEIALGKSNRVKTEGRKFLSWYDMLFFYGMGENRYFRHLQIKRKNQDKESEQDASDEWRSIDNKGESWSKISLETASLLSSDNVRYDNNGHPTSRARIILGKEFLPPDGRRFPSQEDIEGMESQGLIRINEQGTPQMKKPDTVYMTDNWTDLFGYSRNWDFSTENSESVLERVICCSSRTQDTICDFFAGSGTTIAVAQKLGRKWLGIEMGDHFYSVILPRMKKTLAGHQSGISKDIDYKGGGAFVYYTLEQYEESLSKAHYQDTRQLTLDSNKSPFEQYAFFADDKLTHALKALKNGKIKIDLHKLYSDIDIPVTLANALGYSIRNRNADNISLINGETEKTNISAMNEDEKQRIISLLRHHLWWGA